MLSPTPFQPDDVGITSVRQAVLVLRAACLLIVLLDCTPTALHVSSAREGISRNVSTGQGTACRSVRWLSWSRRSTEGCAGRAFRGRSSSHAWTLWPSSAATGGLRLQPSLLCQAVITVRTARCRKREP